VPARALAVVLALALAALPACTRHEPRPPLREEMLRADWAALDPQPFTLGDIAGEGVVLTPDQWPLEASVKRLLQLDFTGVVTDFDLRFRSGTLRGDVLEALFDAGYLPAYVRVRNNGDEPRPLSPQRLVVRADEGTALYAVHPLEVPQRLERLDWARTGTAVVVAALAVVLVLAAQDDSAMSDLAADSAHLTLRMNIEGRGVPSPLVTRDPGGRAAAPAEPELTGLLRPRMLAPGEEASGFVFFRLDETVADWRSVRLATE